MSTDAPSQTPTTPPLPTAAVAPVAGDEPAGTGAGAAPPAAAPPQSPTAAAAPKRQRTLRVAVEGCCHGRLDEIYDRLGQLGKVDLLVICGDFQAVRNLPDLACMACPDKYKSMNTFYKYYAGQQVAPVPTVFIGGNHEASNYLQELFYGGWVADNIYYLGAAGVVRFGGLRIAGLSGIYNEQRYNNVHMPRDEAPPYTRGGMRSVYHVRPLQATQLGLLSKPIDIMLSHDWPRGIAPHGNVGALLKKKPFLRKEIHENSLGSLPAEILLRRLQPRQWCSAHMHVKFGAEVHHALLPDPNSLTPAGGGRQQYHPNGQQHETSGPVTRFLSLDKCLPGRACIEVLEFVVEDDRDEEPVLDLDEEWLAIIRATHQYVAKPPRDLPPFTDLQQEVNVARDFVRRSFGGNYAIPKDAMAKTVPAYNDSSTKRKRSLSAPQPPQRGNPQTDALFAKLGLEHIAPVTVPYWRNSSTSSGGDDPQPNESAGFFRLSDGLPPFEPQQAASAQAPGVNAIAADVGDANEIDIDL